MKQRCKMEVRQKRVCPDRYAGGKRVSKEPAALHRPDGTESRTNRPRNMSARARKAARSWWECEAL